MEFWAHVKDIGRSLSLISRTEAKKYGGMSDVSDKQAEEVRREDLYCSL
jgi:ATP-dependent DNA helicase 2 subunit 2